MQQPSNCRLRTLISPFFFFNDTATTEIYTLSLHDALPISGRAQACPAWRGNRGTVRPAREDRKSTRLNSSHSQISYAVFCLKKKKKCMCTVLLVKRMFKTYGVNAHHYIVTSGLFARYCSLL